MSSIVKPLTLDHPRDIGSVDFAWSEDRFDHSIQLDQTKIACKPGITSDSWPDSPPIQQLSIETIEGRDVALGVGCAGTSHWSLSVEPTDNGFRFDWACCVKETPRQLGTTYASNKSVEFTAGDDAAVLKSEAEIRIVPKQSVSASGTYRWQYEVHVAR